MLKPTILQKGLFIVLVPFAINLIWIGLFWHSLQRAATWAETEDRDAAVIVLVSRTIVLMNSTIIGGTEYLTSAGDERLRLKEVATTDHLLEVLTALNAETKHDQEIGKITKSLFKRFSDWVQNLKILHAAPTTFKREDLTDLGMPEQFFERTGSDLTKLVIILGSRGEKFRTTIQEEEIERTKTKMIAFSGLCLNLAIAFALVLFLKGNITSRISKLINNARALSDSTYLPQEISGADELNQLDKELKAVRAELLAASIFRHSFMEMMAHNIQSPLEICIKTISDLEHRDQTFGEERSVKHLKSLRLGTSSCLRLVDDLLLLESLESGALEVHLQPADIRKLVDTAIELVSSLATLKNIDIVNNTASQLIEVDANRLLQVLINLISNAIKFSPTKSCVTVTSSQTSSNLRISVADQGQGMDKSVRAQLFQKFYQAEAGRQAGGTGLGLAIAKLIVQAHNGLIGVDSTAGHGSTFWFELPLREQ